MANGETEEELAPGPLGRCVFCAIANHEEATRVVLEDAKTIAFLDRRPLFPGHTLLVPKAHFETLSELPSNLLLPLFSNVQLLSSAVTEATRSDGTFVAINNRVSQSVPHLHVHIVPRRRGDGMKGFFWPRHPYASAEAAAEMEKAIRSALDHIKARP